MKDKSLLKRIWESVNVVDSDTVDDEEGKKLIVKTIFKLPKAIRERVLEKKVIFIYSYCRGFIRSLIFRERISKNENVTKILDKEYITIEIPFIILNFQKMKKGKEMNTIAHEIAHFVLGHYKMEKLSDGKIEREADDLTKKWGFERVYTKKHYKKFEKD